RALEPVECLDVAALDEARVLDLETRGQAVDEEHAAAGVLGLDLHNSNEAIVLLHCGRATGGALQVYRLAVQRVVAALDLEAAGGGRLRRQSGAVHCDDGVGRVAALVADD